MQRYFEINEAGMNIRCKIYCENIRNVRKAVIMAHGFGGHKDNKAAEKFAERILSKYHGIAVITFNWPCHGDDVRKKLALSDCLKYLELVVSYTQNTWTEELYGYATSFGGYMMLYSLTELGSPFRKLALRCPAVRMYDVMSRSLVGEKEQADLAKKKEALVGFDRKVPVSTAFLEELKAADITKRDFLDWAEDILILHGSKDEIVPMEESRQFCDDQLIEFLPIENADHRFQNPDCMEAATKAVIRFFAF